MHIREGRTQLMKRGMRQGRRDSSQRSHKVAGREQVWGDTVATVKGVQSHVTAAFAQRTFLDASHVTRRSAHL